MKKGVVIVLFLVLSIGIISAIPFISFVNPTPSHGTQTTGSSLTINSTITGVSNLLKFVFNWQGTNYSLYDEDLILHLSLNNNSALGENNSLVYDSSRGGHNGSVLDGAEYIVSGKYAGAYNFTGGLGINISASEDFNVDEFTISLWVKLRKKRVIDFDISEGHSCFIDESNNLFCVGRNLYGELGDGTVSQKVEYKKISSNYTFTQVFTGYKHTCALIENGSALCWGENGGYQFGNGGTTDSYVPTFVSGNHNFTSIFGGDYNTCGVLENLTILCWGYGTSGQFGDGTINNGVVPRILAPDFNFSMIAPGELHMCGILNNGSLYCWGENNEGQLGVGNITNLNYPHHISGSLNFSYIDSGEDQTCGVLTNGSALCWGENNEGNIGTGNVTSPITIPTFVNTSFLFSKIWLAKHIACGNLTNGSFACWGANNQGGVYGDSTTKNSLVPKIVNWGIEFDEIYDSRYNSDRLCATKDSIPYCWGENYYGQSGLGTTSNLKIPVKFSFNGNETFSPGKVSIGTSSTCMINDQGFLYCRGYNVYSGNLGRNNTINDYTPEKVFGNYNFSEIELSNTHSCGLLQNGSALCWGSNTYGQVGDGTSGTDRYVPTYVKGDNLFGDIHLSAVFGCGLLNNGSALCWGRNNFGQLGMGNNTQMYIPQFSSGGYNFSTISLGRLHVCGLLQNGSALCWGRNNFGQLGLGTSNTTTMYAPTYVSGGYNFNKISLGEYNSCGLLQNGSALCWGSNIYGQLGDNSTSQREYPYFVYGNNNFSNIVLGQHHSCGFLQNGSALCWGRNNYGELGNLNLNISGKSTIPINSAKGLAFSDYDHYYSKNGNCFFNGTNLYCWGSNWFGILGDNSLPSLSPAEVYLGDILGKSDASFKIGSTLNGSIRAFVSQRWLDMPAEEGWNQVIFVYNGTKSILYLNGEKQFEHTEDLMLFPQDIDLNIGSNLTGEVDEVFMWNRTLTASEIQKVYESSLQQRNHTAWEFYSSQSLPSVGTYSYSLFATDTTGSFSILRRIIKYVVESVVNYVSPGGSASITVTETKLQEGQTRQLRKGAKVKLEFSNQGSKILEIINVKDESVIVKVGDVEVEVVNGTTEKIDVNNDGFYDLEVSVEDISSSGSSRLKFKEIYEAVESDVEEAVEEGVKEDIIDEPEVVDEKSKWWVYFVIIAGVVGLLVGLWFVFFKKK